MQIKNLVIFLIMIIAFLYSEANKDLLVSEITSNIDSLIKKNYK